MDLQKKGRKRRIFGWLVGGFIWLCSFVMISRNKCISKGECKRIEINKKERGK